MYTELTASMMCADFGNLGKEVRELEAAGVDSFHIDIMDTVMCLTLQCHLMTCDI